MSTCLPSPIQPNFCLVHNAVWDNDARICTGWEPRLDDHVYQSAHPDDTAPGPFLCKRCGYLHTGDRETMYDRACLLAPRFLPHTAPEPDPFAKVVIPVHLLLIPALRDALVVGQARLHTVRDARNPEYADRIGDLIRQIDKLGEQNG